MSLELPADIEPFLSDKYDDWTAPCVYALTLDKPDDLGDAWDRTFETRPDYFDVLDAKTAVVYIGATKNCIHRLEDHRDGDVRTAAPLEVCDIDELRNIWWFDTAEAAFNHESRLANWASRHYPDTYVHSR